MCDMQMRNGAYARATDANSARTPARRPLYTASAASDSWRRWSSEAADMAYLCNEESISHSITLARHHSYTAVQRAKASSQDTGASRPKPSASVRVLRITPRAPRVNREVRHWDPGCGRRRGAGPT